MFRFKAEEVGEERRNRRNARRLDLCCSPSVVRVIKFGRMRRAGHVARSSNKETIGP